MAECMPISKRPQLRRISTSPAMAPVIPSNAAVVDVGDCRLPSIRSLFPFAGHGLTTMDLASISPPRSPYGRHPPLVRVEVEPALATDGAVIARSNENDRSSHRFVEDVPTSNYIGISAAESRTQSEPPLPESMPRMLRGSFELQGDRTRGETEYGRGGWSKVVQALYYTDVPSESQLTKPNLPSPPDSPARHVHDAKPAEARIVAVKLPRKHNMGDVAAIIEQEACVLTHIQPLSPKRKAWQHEHVVTFFGFESVKCALVLEPLPITLAGLARTRAKSVKDTTYPVKTELEPIVGREQWLIFASKLVAGLKYLHDMNVVHGDIKPMNILLRSRPSPTRALDGLDMARKDRLPIYDPVYCDFSSSHVLQPGTMPPLIPAVTEEYAAPELLAAHLRSSVGPIATFSSDVYSLGSTLIVPATGTEMYSEASSKFEKLNLISPGAPLLHARRVSLPTRVPENGIVDRLLRGAVVKDVSKRLDLRAWKALVDREVAQFI